jgi:cold shock protein
MIDESSRVATSAPAVASDKTAAEIRKLNAEAQKLKAERRVIGRQGPIELVKTSIAAATVLATAITFFLSWNQQQTARADAESHRREDSFVTYVRSLSDTAAPKARLTALYGLEGFWEEERFRRRLAHIVVGIAGMEKDPAVLVAMSELLARHPDSVAFSVLADRNRELQVKIALAHRVSRRLVQQSTDIDKPMGIDRAGVVGFANEVDLNNSITELQWNIATLLRSMNSARHLRDVNLSGVMLSIITLSGSTADKSNVIGSFVIEPRSSVELDSGLTFERVSFENSNLATLRFEGARFLRTKLDGATLLSTRFQYCFFDSTSSIAGFSPALAPRGKVDDQIGVGPDFDGCTLEGTPLYAAKVPFASNLTRDKKIFFRLLQSSWKIPRPPSDYAAEPIDFEKHLEGDRSTWVALDSVDTPFERTIETDVLGVVKWFNPEKGFGFIAPGARRDCFVHFTHVSADFPGQELREGDSVTVDLAENNKGPFCKNVRLPSKRKRPTE